MELGSDFSLNEATSMILLLLLFGILFHVEEEMKVKKKITMIKKLLQNFFQ